MTTAAVPECPIVVIGNSLHQVKHRAWQAAHRSIPVVSHPHVQVSGVKVFKVLIERNEILRRRRRKNEQPQSEALTGCHRAAVGCQRKQNTKKPRTVVTLQAERTKKKERNQNIVHKRLLNRSDCPLSRLLKSFYFGDSFILCVASQ